MNMSYTVFKIVIDTLYLLQDIACMRYKYIIYMFEYVVQVSVYLHQI